MKTLGRLALLLALLTASDLFAQREIIHQVPKEMVIIGRLDFDAVFHSKLVTQLTQARAEQYLQIQLILLTLGLDINQVRTLWIMSAKPDTAVIILQGAFKIDLIRAKLGALPNVVAIEQPGCEYAVQMPDDKKPGKINMAAFQDRDTLVFGEQSCVVRYLTQLTEPAQLFPKDDPQLQKLNESQSQVVATILGDLRRWPQMDPKVASLVKELWINGDVDQDVTLTLQVRVLNPKMAEGVELLARGLALTLVNDDGHIPLPALLRKALETVVVDRNQDQVTAWTKLPGAELLKLIGGAPAAPAAAGPAPLPLPAAPAPAK